MAITFQKFNSDLVGLAWKFEVNPETCDNPSHYENYLRMSAITDEQAGESTTHVLLDTENDESRIAGFMSLRAAALIEKIEEFTYGYPALEVSQLAIDKKYEGHNFGTVLLQLALYLADKSNKEIMGVKHIILRSVKASVEFYEKFGFKRLDEFSLVPVDGYNKGCVPMVIRIKL